MRSWSRFETNRAMAFTTLAALADLASVVSLVVLMSAVFDPAGGGMLAHFGALLAGSQPAPHQPTIPLALSVFFAVMAIRALLAARRDSANLRLQAGYTAYLQSRIMAGLAQAPWSEVEALRHDRVLHALGAETVRAASAAQLLLQIGGAGLALILQFILALVISPLVAGGVAVVLVIAAAGFSRSLLSSGRMGAELGQRGGSLAQIAQQFLGGLKLAKAQNLERGFIAGFAGLAESTLRLRLGFQERQIRNRQGLTFAAAIAAAVFLVLGARSGLGKSQLLAAFAVLSRISAAGTTLFQQLQLITGTLPAHTAIRELVAELGDTPTEAAPPSRPRPAAPQAAPGTELVRCENLSYASNGVERLCGASFALAAGEVVALTGGSGAGKTTLIDLLTGLLTPTSGRVLVQGAALDRAGAYAWRDRIAYITQETWLANDTIRANLRRGEAAGDDAALWEALRLVGAEGLVRSAEHGLDTPVHEQGSRFSGGERQRLALARALLREPELLILDEATNAIDPTAERDIMDRIHDAMPGMTWLVIAHRPSTLAFCRREIALERGRLIADRPR